MASAPNQLSLARFAFNIYGNSGHDRLSRAPEQKTSRKRLIYACEREITCLSQLQHPLGRITSPYYDASSTVPANHVVIGGKNYLKLLALNQDQSAILADVNMVEPPLQTRFSSQKLFNVNTMKCNGDMVACGLTNGAVSIFQINGNGRAKLAYKLEDHKRVINSLDFVDLDQVLLSGSQDGTVRLWDLRTFSPKPVLKLQASQHSDPVRACQYSPHSRVRGKMTVLSVHDLGALCKFDLRYPNNTSGSGLPERKWTFHTGPALSLHIHPESEHVITGGRDRKICVWNYAESALHTVSPEVILNTYGPVMKIRWSETPEEETEATGNSLDFPDDYEIPLPIHNYDFACLYLNDDPTITVYNLRRKYIPKEIITTATHKPIQNFIWAKNSRNERKIWTITKSNVFVSYNLSGDEPSVSRPLENLPSVATAWTNGFSNISFVSQEKNEFYYTAPEHSSLDPEEPENSAYTDDLAREDYDRTLEHQLSSHTLDNSYLYSSAKHPIESLPNLSNLFYKTNLSLNSSPKDRPQLMRLATHNPQLKTPSPVPQQRPSMLETFGGFGLSLLRPSIVRNPSQTTQDSGSLSSLFIQPHASVMPVLRKAPLRNVPSPYFVSVSIPVPLNDDSVFEVLSNEYHIAIPDGFSLSHACHMNARVAASVQRYRDCQVWRMLAVALEQEDFDHNSRGSRYADSDTRDNDDVADNTAKSEEDVKSILSDLGNFVGSFNSNSTLTTNYGSAPHKSGSNSSFNNLAALSSSKDSSKGSHSLKDFKSASTHSLETSHSHGNLNSLVSWNSPSVSRSNSILLNEKNRPFLQHPETLHETNSEQAIEDDDPGEKELQSRKNSVRSNGSFSRKPSAIDIKSKSIPGYVSPLRAISPDFSSEGSPQNYSILGRGNVKRNFSFGASFGKPVAIPGSDLDNENLNILNNATASLSSSGYLAGTEGGKFNGGGYAPGGNPRSSFLSIRTSPMAPAHGFGSRSSVAGNRINTHISKGGSSSNLLERVEESSIHSKEPRESALTRAINRKNESMEELAGDSEASDKPWNTINMIAKAVTFALDQGDVVLCSVLILLFYEPFRKSFASKVMSKNSCLECLGLYVETLRSRELFTNAVEVVKEAPGDLKYKLGIYASKEVDLRFYCCWCEKLLVNETTKAKYSGTHSKNFGYWYCDECSKKQLNCVYCNEPCKGLTVVVSLKCGHRGHFGCLQDWFLEGENTECPGGCEVLES